MDEYNLAYNTTLNLMDIRTGVSKFYKMQLLCSGKGVSDTRSSSRGGGSAARRAETAACTATSTARSSTRTSPTSKAPKEFEQKFRELACVDFTACASHAGAGRLQRQPDPWPAGQDVSEAARQAAAAKVKESVAGAAAAATAPSTLPPSVQEFVELVFSERMMQQQLESLSIDLNKMPLGGISDVQTEQGYAVLRQIAEALKSPLPDAGAQSQRLLGLTNQFYNVIPHKFARKQTPPVITSREMLIEKIEAIDALLSVSAANSISAGMAEATAPTAHPTDANYAKLGCGLEPASPEEVEMVKEYAKATHAKTHNSYTLSIKHVQAAEPARPSIPGSARQSPTAVAQLAPDQLGGHPLTGAAHRPLRRPSPATSPARASTSQTPVSKSANYCMATRELPAVLLLRDVALSKQRADRRTVRGGRTLGRGEHSTWGVGKTPPIRWDEDHRRRRCRRACPWVSFELSPTTLSASKLKVVASAGSTMSSCTTPSRSWPNTWLSPTCIPWPSTSDAWRHGRGAHRARIARVASSVLSKSLHVQNGCEQLILCGTVCALVCENCCTANDPT